MKHGSKSRRDAGPTQRQLRAGELVRHALAEVLREEEINDGALEGVSVTVTEVRMSPDLRHAICFIEPLGGVHVRAVVEGLNRAAKFLRGKLGRHIDLKFTPDLRFMHDETFEEADRMGRLIADARHRDESLHGEDVDQDDDEAPVGGSVRVFPSAPSDEEKG
ncbi:MAG: 30S ribosome-binding factor RbfA [Caulobacteraceae bacterium]